MDEVDLAKDYFEYNPEEDPTGSKGREIADRVFRHCNFDFEKMHKWISIDGKGLYLEKIAEENEKNNKAITIYI